MPLRWDRRLFAGLLCGAAICLTSVNWPGPATPQVDFSAIQYAEGRLYCTSYMGRNGSEFRIDDVHYDGGHCTRQQHGFHGPRVRAGWVPVPGAEPRRLLLSLVDLQTGAVIFHRTPATAARQIADDPFSMFRLMGVLAGAVVIVGSLAASHRRAAADSPDRQPLEGSHP